MLGLRIAAQRKIKGISQTELARRLCISPSAIGMYEQGRREPSNNILVALSKELNVSTDFLLTGQNWPIQKDSTIAFLIYPNKQIAPSKKDLSVQPLSVQELKAILYSLLQET